MTIAVDLDDEEQFRFDLSMCSTFTCHLCYRQVPEVQKMAHTPRCYYIWCNQVMKTAPFCTCSDCAGRQQHPTDRNSPASLPLSTRRPMPTTPPPNPGTISSGSTTPPSHTVSPSQRPVDGQPKPPQEITPEHASGKACLCCDSKKGSTSILLLNVGRYATFRLCKKAHLDPLQQPRDVEKVSSLLTKMVTFVRQTKDQKASVLQIISGTTSEEDFEDKFNFMLSTHVCAGYSRVNSTNPRKCSKQTKDGFVFVELSEGKKFFCDADCMIRFMIVEMARGRGTNPKKRTPKTNQQAAKTSTTASTSEENDVVEEELLPSSESEFEEEEDADESQPSSQMLTQDDADNDNAEGTQKKRKRNARQK